MLGGPTPQKVLPLYFDNIPFSLSLGGSFYQLYNVVAGRNKTSHPTTTDIDFQSQLQQSSMWNILYFHFLSSVFLLHCNVGLWKVSYQRSSIVPHEKRYNRGKHGLHSRSSPYFTSYRFLSSFHTHVCPSPVCPLSQYDTLAKVTDKHIKGAEIWYFRYDEMGPWISSLYPFSIIVLKTCCATKKF